MNKDPLRGRIPSRNVPGSPLENLRNRFPHANLFIENRSIGGHSSQLLVKTAEADLYPFQPDLVIFHVYGSHLEYENIIRGIRERTTAEILIQNDHVNKVADLTEETDPAKIGFDQWDSFMNHKSVEPGQGRHSPWPRLDAGESLRPGGSLDCPGASPT